MPQMKERDKAMAGDLSDTDMSNRPDREFKVVIITIFTGLEERVKDMNETLNTQVRYNKAEVNVYNK